MVEYWVAVVAAVAAGEGTTSAELDKANIAGGSIHYSDLSSHSCCWCCWKTGLEGGLNLHRYQDEVEVGSDMAHDGDVDREDREDLAEEGEEDSAGVADDDECVVALMIVMLYRRRQYKYPSDWRS